MRSRRRKDIPPMKRRRGLRPNHPLRIPDLPRRHNPIAILHQRQQPIIRNNKKLPLLRLRNNRLPRTPHRRIHDNNKHCIIRKIRCRPRQKPRPFRNIERRHLMRNIQNPHPRSHTIHHRLAYPHRIIANIEVRHKPNHPQSLRVSRSPLRLTKGSKRADAQPSHQSSQQKSTNPMAKSQGSHLPHNFA